VRSEAAVTRLAMFPLGTVLVPTEVLPLHIFEPRYRQMIADLAGGPWSPEGAELGIVLISRGSEVGGGETRETVGTVAHLLEATALPDGRWLILVVGTRRFRVVDWLPDDPYPLAGEALLLLAGDAVAVPVQSQRGVRAGPEHVHDRTAPGEVHVARRFVELVRPRGGDEVLELGALALGQVQDVDAGVGTQVGEHVSVCTPPHVQHDRSPSRCEGPLRWPAQLLLVLAHEAGL
jgi:hypothetical protein